jgi:hypothetical protein
MQTFERSVLITALIILIVTLAIMGVALKKKAEAGEGPPQSECPDFWFSSFYTPCAMSTYGCCADGVTPANEGSGSNCASAVDCKSSKFGCCDDGYTSKSSTSGLNCPKPGPATCYNVHKMGKPPVGGHCLLKEAGSFRALNGQNSLCIKQGWAQECGVAWDGVTNVENACI